MIEDENAEKAACNALPSPGSEANWGRDSEEPHFLLRSPCHSSAFKARCLDEARGQTWLPMSCPQHNIQREIFNSETPTCSSRALLSPSWHHFE